MQIQTNNAVELLDPEAKARSTKRDMAVAMTVLVLATMADMALAQGTGGTGNNPVLNFLNGIIAFLNQGVMRAVAILAAFSLGVACYLGRIGWEMTMKVMGGLILTFGGSALVDQFSGMV